MLHPSTVGSGSGGENNPTTSVPAATDKPIDDDGDNFANGSCGSSKSSSDTGTTQTLMASSTLSVSPSITTSLPLSSTQSNLPSMSTTASSSDDAQPSSSNDNNADDDVTSAQSVNSESSASKVTPVLAFVAATSLVFLKLM